MSTEIPQSATARSPRVRGLITRALGIEESESSRALKQYSQTAAGLEAAAGQVGHVLEAVTVETVSVASQAPRPQRWYEFFRSPAHDLRTVPLTEAIGAVHSLSRSIVEAGELSVQAATTLNQAVETDKLNKEQALAAKVAQKAADRESTMKILAERRALEKDKSLKWAALAEVIVVNPVKAARDKYQAVKARKELYKNELPEEKNARRRREKAERQLTAALARQEMAEAPGVDDVVSQEVQRLTDIVTTGNSDVPESAGVLRARVLRRRAIAWTVGFVAIGTPVAALMKFGYDNYLSPEAKQAAAQAYRQERIDFETRKALGVDSQVETTDHIVRHPKLEENVSFIQKGEPVVIDAEKNRRPIKGFKTEQQMQSQGWGTKIVPTEVVDTPSVRLQNYQSEDGKNKVMLLIRDGTDYTRLFSGDPSTYEFRFPDNRPDLRQSGLNGEYVEFYNKKTKTSFYIKIDRPETEDPNILRITYFQKVPQES